MKSIKKLLILLIWFFFLTSCVYAADSSSSAEIVAWIQNIVQILYMITWPLLIIAGKALGTDFVYGTAFGMDYSLWALWQISRTVANYALGFAMIIAIFWFFWNVEKFNIKSIGPKIVLASIVINASWFILWALLDLSIIITLAVGHMWDAFIDKNSDKNRVVAMATVINLEEKATISPWDYKWCAWDGTANISGADECLQSCTEWIKVAGKIKEDCKTLKSPKEGITLEDLESGSDGFTGPLFGLFRFVNDASHIWNNTTDEDLIFVTAIKLIVLIMLILPLLWIAIVAIVRVFMLWMFIWFAPLILGAYTLGVWWDKVRERFNNVLSIIFMPVVLVFGIVIWLVFISALTELIPMGEDKWLMENLDFKVWEGEVVFPNPEKVEGNYELLKIKLEGEPTGKTTWLFSDMKNLSRWFGWIIINVLCSFILWVIFLAAMKMNKITDKIWGTMKNLVSWSLKTAPILPMWQSVGSLEAVWEQLQRVPENIDAGRRHKLNKKLQDISDWMQWKKK